MLQIQTRYRRAVARAFATIGMIVLLLATWPPARASAELPTIVFLAPADLDPQTRASLEDALATQVALVGVRLVLRQEPSSNTPPLLEDRVLASKSIAAEHAALGVLWLEVRPGDHWFVYATDADAERVVVRPLLVRPESVASAIETVAVIARGSAEALLHGEPVAGDTVTAPPPTAAAPAPPPPPAAAPAARPAVPVGRLRLALAYAGTTFSADQVWQSGMQVSAAWLWTQGPFVGLGYTWFPAHEFGSALQVSVQRHPLSAVVGYAWKLDAQLRLDAELGGTLHLLSRHTLETPSGVAARSDATRAIFALAPSLRGEYELGDWLGVFVTLGADVLVNDFDYVAAPSGGATLLDPYRVRLRALAGVSILH